MTSRPTETMRKTLFVLLASALIAGACTNDSGDRDEEPSRGPGSSSESPSALPADIVGVDLFEAVTQLERQGYEVRFGDGVSESERGYATGLQTHPTVEVVDFELEGSVVVITDAACPDKREVC